MSAFSAVVLAAGQGTRMKSAKPKVLHQIAGLPMLSHVIAAAKSAGAARCAVVIPPDTEAFEEMRADTSLRFFVQAERLGTAHAVLTARDALLDAIHPVVVLYGDTPLVRAESVARIVAVVEDGASLVVAGFETARPYGYGRLLAGENGRLLGIREEKDANPEERAIGLCNSGIMAFAPGVAPSLLGDVGNDNAAREYYLTDAVHIANGKALRCMYLLIDGDEVRGVNNRVQLGEAETAMQARLRKRAMDGGATLIAPETVTFAHDTNLGQDVLIEPHVFFGPGVSVADGVTIRGFSHIEGADIAQGATIGPFARLRPGTRIRANARVGNFVEVKEAVVSEDAKVNHLSYIGDAHVGRGANVGAGTVTCNYDGTDKHRTEIGDGAFIGSNSSLVAPVRIGDSAYVGSGSVITEDVPANALAIGRARQIMREDWAQRRKDES